MKTSKNPHACTFPRCLVAPRRKHKLPSPLFSSRPSSISTKTFCLLSCFLMYFFPLIPKSHLVPRSLTSSAPKTLFFYDLKNGCPSFTEGFFLGVQYCQNFPPLRRVAFDPFSFFPWIAVGKNIPPLQLQPCTSCVRFQNFLLSVGLDGFPF